MTNIKFYLVTVDRFDHRVISQLSPEEREKVICYAVNSSKPKLIAPTVKVIKEWELKWYTPRYQTLMYYEYGIIPHCMNNPELIEGLTHIGIMHYDARFPKNSINEIIQELNENPRTIYYNLIRQNDVLYFTRDQLNHICEYMSEKLDMFIDPEKIWNDGFLTESFSIMPIDVFTKFGDFMVNYQYDFENMLNTNKWGLMSTVRHRLCGFTERLYGMYLMCCGLPLKQMNILHERELYTHAHIAEREKFVRGINNI